MTSICVFCGSNPGRRPEYLAAVTDLGRVLAADGIEVVYGGAHVGAMGALADAVLDAGGRVVGVIPQQLVEAEIAHHGLSQLHVVESMHQRKAMMADLADGFIALPGGMGTLDEISEVVTWSQLGLHVKPTGLLNIAGYYDALLQFLDHAVDERFLRQQHRDLIVVGTDPRDLLDGLRAWAPEPTEKWVDAEGVPIGRSQAES